MRRVRVALGLPVPWFAAYMSVTPVTVRAWELACVVPPHVVEAVEMLALEANVAVTRMTERLKQEQLTVVVTYQSDHDLEACEPEPRFPASWHRAIAARVAHRTGAQIVYRIT